MLNREKVSKKKVFAPLLPPPNITGKLHLGHFFDQMISNIYIRNEQRKNRQTFFAPFLDHGGISTEVLIKKTYGNLKEENIKIFENEHKKYVLEDLLSSSFSFNKEIYLYTLDPDYKELTEKVFFSLYNDKLLKRFFYIVNWCDNCKTVISDEELIYKEKKQKMFYLKYYKNENEYITIATTKPETIIFDELIITDNINHPEKVKVPLTQKEIPVIYSPKNVSKKKGTNYIKITPSIDKTDFYIYQSIFNEIPFVETKNIEKIDLNLLSSYIEKVEDIISSTPRCYRCNTEIVNTMKKQWFLDLKLMSKDIELSNIKLFPNSLEEEIILLKEKINFWCISRQLKFGHQIPLYCDICNSFVDKCFCKNKEHIEKEVFDSWFVSSLCSIYHYEKTGTKTNFLSCGRDILFFWVIKMIIMNKYYFKKEIFSTIFCHSLLRDKFNNKLSKSKGNYIVLSELRDKLTDNGLIYILLSSFKKSEDLKLDVSENDFNNFCIKISNALFMYENLSSFPNVHLDIEGKLNAYFNFINNEFEKLLNNFELKKAFFLVKDFLFNHIFNFYFEILKRNRVFSNFAFDILNKSFNLLSTFFPNIDHIFPLFKKIDIVTSKDKDYESYFDIFFFVKEFRSLKSNFKYLYISDTKNIIPKYIKVLLNIQDIEYKYILGNSSIYKKCFFFTNEKNNLFNKEKIMNKIIKIQADLEKMKKFSTNDFNSFLVKKTKITELNILEILIQNDTKDIK